MQISNATNNCLTAVVVFDRHKQLVSINRTATCITHSMEYARLEVSSMDQLKFVCFQRGICNPRRCDNVWISRSIVLIRGDRGWLMHILVFLIYLMSGKTHLIITTVLTLMSTVLTSL